MSNFESWKDWFYFNKSERRGLLVLYIVLVIIAFTPTIVRSIKQAKEEPQVDYSRYYEQLDDLVIIEKNSKPTTLDTGYSNQKKKELHTNSISATNLSQARENNQSNEKLVKQNISKQQTPIDINKASAQDLEQLPGIGPVLSTRIVKFRNSLGGFVRISQVGETFGIEPEVFNQIKSSLVLDTSFVPQKIDFNSYSAEQLQAHPYISPQLAKQIVNYREKVHPFESREDVEALYFMDEELYQRLKDYIIY